MKPGELKEIRKQRNLTQEQLGKKLGLNRRTIGRYELGEFKIPKQTALALKALLPSKRKRPSKNRKAIALRPAQVLRPRQMFSNRGMRSPKAFGSDLGGRHKWRLAGFIVLPA